MCSMVASSSILAVQLAERALTACNYCQNHLLRLSVNAFYYFQTCRRVQARARRRRACAQRRKDLCYKGGFFLLIAQKNAHF